MSFDEFYRNTSYWVEDGKSPFKIRVGESNPQLENLLHRHGATCWSYVTASNPRSIPLTFEENEGRYAALLRLAQSLGYRTISGYGVGDDGAWPPEKSLLIIGIEREKARELGRKFEQNAIIVGEKGGLPELLMLN